MSWGYKSTERSSSDANLRIENFLWKVDFSRNNLCSIYPRLLWEGIGIARVQSLV